MQKLLVLIKRISLFLNLKAEYKKLFIEALFITGKVRLLMRFFPFKCLRKIMGEYNKLADYCLDEIEYKLIEKISWTVLLVCRHTPWESKCLVQAITVKNMLKRRNIETTVCLGITKDKGDHILAHAWLKCGDIIITGETKEGLFAKVACFS